MSEQVPPTQSEIQLKIRELLGRATLLRTKGQRAEALQLTQQAIALDEKGWEAHELAGDLQLEAGRGDFALDSYRKAHELNPSRTALEDKIARAALARAARLQTVEMSQALLSGRIKPSTPRKSGFAALMSMIVPGLGQLYNGEAIKGFVLVALWVACFALMGMSLKSQIVVGPASSQGSLYGPSVDLGSIASAMFSGLTAIWSILTLVIWIYAIADAAIVANRANSSDTTGLT